MHVVVVAAVPVTLDTAFAIRALNVRAMVWISSDNAQRVFDRRPDDDGDDDDGCLRMGISTDPLRRHMRLLRGLCREEPTYQYPSLLLSLLCYAVYTSLFLTRFIHIRRFSAIHRIDI